MYEFTRGCDGLPAQFMWGGHSCEYAHISRLMLMLQQLFMLLDHHSLVCSQETHTSSKDIPGKI